MAAKAKEKEDTSTESTETSEGNTTAESTETTEAVLKAVPVDPDLVIAQVLKRYTIVMDDHSTVTHVPGNHPMPRSQAEHFYAKANGTTIIGIPDNGNLEGVGAKARLKGIVETLSAQQGDIVAFVEQHPGLTDQQKDGLTKSSKFVEGAVKLLGAL
ncbi:MAG: hypothetical protein KGI08_05615 [Thaumarchaeota archaeon]|nr:hypothetical protein [Nitrososphaerota archaeon]